MYLKRRIFKFHSNEDGDLTMSKKLAMGREECPYFGKRRVSRYVKIFCEECTDMADCIDKAGFPKVAREIRNCIHKMKTITAKKRASAII